MNAKTIYTITNTRPTVPVKVNVCFEPLTTDDVKTIRGEDWRTALFYEVWIETAEHETGWKLTLCEGEDKPILGLIRLGTAPQLNGDKGALSGSLLESVPVHQYGTAQRGYKGIGRVLIARLVEESKAQGADGSVRVRPAQGTVPFYERLGFYPSRIAPYYRLDAQAAEILLRACQEK